MGRHRQNISYDIIYFQGKADQDILMECDQMRFKYVQRFCFKIKIYTFYFNIVLAQSAGAVEYTDCTSAEG